MYIELPGSRIIHLKDGKIVGDEKIKNPKDAESEFKQATDLNTDNLSKAMSKHE